MEVAVKRTDRTIPHTGTTVSDLPAKVRMGEQLQELLGRLTVSSVFEAAAGTIVGLPRGAKDPQGTKDNNYFRIDLQQDPQPGRSLNIQYQVSRATVACALVGVVAEEVKVFGMSGIQEALRKSFESGEFPKSGAKNSGSPQHIFTVEVVAKQEKKKIEEVSPPSVGEPTRQERKAQREAEEKERRQKFLSSLGQKPPTKPSQPKPAGKDGKR